MKRPPEGGTTNTKGNSIMHGRKWLVAAPVAAAALLSGCTSGLLPWQTAQRYSPHDTRMVATSATPQPATAPAEVLRSQSPDDNAGLFDFPSLDAIKDSPAVNGVMKLIGRDRNETLARQLYKEAEDLFREKNYDDAAAKYKAAARHYADTDLEEDALFMQGECQFFSDRYPAASDAYGELLKKYENSRHLDKVVARQFAIARYWQQLQQAKPRKSLNPNVLDKTRPTWDTGGNALKAYESVRMFDPTGPLADDSIFATANDHFLNEKFDDADYFYSLLRNDYPKSEHLTQAYLLGLRSKLRKYNGPQYDSAALTEAEELINQMLVQFPEELGKEELNRVQQAKLAVEAQIAQRDFEMGEFYYTTKHYRAASFYYQGIVDTYPNSKFAEMSRERLESVKGLPPEPPQRFKWLVNLFPGTSKRRYK